MKKYKCHVVSATHWDREWVKSFQESRVALVDMFDKLFEIIEKDPNFKHFHLDSQTIPLEDYHEVRPENKEKLKKVIKDKKLIVGPWYTLPEMNVIDGECIVRNLLIGHRIAKEYGGVMKVGYTPTSTGQVSQLPQIYNGFGIDSVIFYRGINQELTPTEYIWKAPDGTESIGIRPPQHFSRCTFWGYVYLPIIHKYYDHIEESKTQYWHEHGLAFKLAEDGENEYIELKPRKVFDESYFPQAIEKLKSEILPHMTTNVMISMIGHDASFPHPETPKLIEGVNKYSDEIEMVHSTFDEYVSEIRTILKNRNTNVVVEGEMRHTNISQKWNDAHLYPGVMSTKGRLKLRNREIENLLIRHAEPASSMAYLLDMYYEGPLLDMSWKLVLANHAHDTINACSLDAVYDDAMHRIAQAEDLSKQALKRSISRVVGRINTSSHKDGAVLLTAFNLLPKVRSEVSKVAIDLPRDTSENDIVVKDYKGNEVAIQIVKAKNHGCGVDKVGFGKGFPTKRFEAYVQFENIPGLGYKTFTVEPSSTKKVSSVIGKEGNILENEHLLVKIENNGSLTVTKKDTGKKYANLHYFIDEGELGNAWTPGRIPGAKVYNSTTDGKAKVELIENGPVKATYRVTITMDLPVSAVNDYAARNSSHAPFTVVSDISLNKGSKRIDVETTIDNNIKDHRFRVMFDGNVMSNNYYANMPFDVVKRPIPKPSSPDWTEPVESSDPQVGFIGVSDGKNGLAVINQGLYEAEVIDNPQRTVAITMIRSFYQHGNWTKDRWADEGFQNIGLHKFEYAIYPHSGDWFEGEVYKEYESHSNPLRIAQHSKNVEGDLPQELEVLSVSSNVQISALKKYEHGEGTVIRLFNPSTSNLEVEVSVSKNIKEAQILDMEELVKEKLVPSGNKVKVSVTHHRIVTLLIK